MQWLSQNIQQNITRSTITIMICRSKQRLIHLAPSDSLSRYYKYTCISVSWNFARLWNPDKERSVRESISKRVLGIFYYGDDIKKFIEKNCKWKNERTNERKKELRRSNFVPWKEYPFISSPGWEVEKQSICILEEKRSETKIHFYQSEPGEIDRGGLRTHRKPK